MFYEQLEKTCKEKGISITALVVDLGLSKGNIRNLPKFSIRLRIAELTEMPIQDILTPDELATYKTVKKE